MTTPDTYEQRARAQLAHPERYGLTPDEAAAYYAADMEAESYADRWQAWAESLEPTVEPPPATTAEPEAGLEAEF